MSLEASLLWVDLGFGVAGGADLAAPGVGVVGLVLTLRMVLAVF